MTHQLIPLPSTLILPAKTRGHRRIKSAICDERGNPISTPGGSYGQHAYRPHADESAMLKTLQGEFTGYEVVSRPDPTAAPVARARFEAWTKTPLAAPNATPGEAAAVQNAPRRAIDAELFEL